MARRLKLDYEVNYLRAHRSERGLECTLPCILGGFQITDGFRESGFPGTRDPAGHEDHCCFVIWGRGDQLGEDLRWNPFHGGWGSKKLGQV